MSDTRFILLGIVLIFAGFIVLGIFGSQNFVSTIEAEEFEDCFEYFEDSPPIQVSCDIKLQEKLIFLALVITLIGVGIMALVKGARGRWDQDVKPEDMVGPGGSTSSKSDESD